MKCHPAFFRDVKRLKKGFRNAQEDLKNHANALEKGLPFALGKEYRGEFGAQRVFKAYVASRDIPHNAKNSGLRLMYLYIEEENVRILLHCYIHSQQGGGRGEQDMVRKVKDRLRNLDLDDAPDFTADNVSSSDDEDDE